MDDFIQRVVDEKTELDDRLEKLLDFYDKPEFRALDVEMQKLMSEQITHMTEYSRVLHSRLLLLDI